ncbi:F-box domain-containing protein [Stagonosporopsis vannaccii]|nr:F-box domain-containing protein [Stagonosporopsis vannaccii]
MTGLLSLPLELLVHISSFVSTSDLAALRLTCKQIEKSLWEWFTEEFFVKKQFMITQPSLQALLDISRHVSLSKKLRHLIIATNVYDDLPLRFRDSDACSSYMQGYADQKALLDNGIDREMLTEIFKGLINLETIDVRDFCARRERDGTYWASWGATTVQKETGMRLRESYCGTGSQSRFVSHIFSNLLYAMGVAGRSPPRFEVLFRQQPAGLPDSAFHLSNFTFPAVQPVLHNLRALFLTLNLGDVSAHTYHTYGGGTPARNIHGRSLRHFLHCTPNLVHFRLNFQKFHVDENMEFMRWLGTSPTRSPEPPQPTRITIEEPPPVSFPHLKALEFGQLDVDRDTLLAVLYRFAPKLEHLSLWRMTIKSGPPGPYDPKPNIWAQFFKALASVPDLELKYLKAGALTQTGHKAHFRNEADGEKKFELQREYSGKTMKAFMKGLADDIVVDWPPTLPSVRDGNNSDEDADMYDHDDDGDNDEEDDEE